MCVCVCGSAGDGEPTTAAAATAVNELRKRKEMEKRREREREKRASGNGQASGGQVVHRPETDEKERENDLLEKKGAQVCAFRHTRSSAAVSRGKEMMKSGGGRGKGVRGVV